jgi:hypothetical protein
MAKRQERWRDDLAAARDADLLLAEYARRHGLKAHNLYDARRRARDALAVRGGHTPAQASPVGAGAFVPVMVKADANATNSAQDRPDGLILRARLPNGVQLSWTQRECNSEVLANVLRALAGLPCSS